MSACSTCARRYCSSSNGLCRLQIEGYMSGKTGVVPSNYVQKLTAAEAAAYEARTAAARAAAATNGTEDGTKKQYAVALYDYDPNEHSPNDEADTELVLTQGMVLVLLGDVDEDGFYQGAEMHHEDTVGDVPSNYVSIVSYEEACRLAAEQTTDGDAATGVPNGRHTERPHYVVVEHDYDPNEHSPNDEVDDELHIRIGQVLEILGDVDEDGFYPAVHIEGEMEGTEGLVPSNYVSALEGEPVDDLFQALYAFDPNADSPNDDCDDELPMAPDDVIKVLGDIDEDGFYSAVAITGQHVGRSGLVPSNFIKEMYVVAE